MCLKILIKNGRVKPYYSNKIDTKGEDIFLHTYVKRRIRLLKFLLKVVVCKGNHT